MSYLGLSVVQAEELLAHMKVREPFRLQSLARRIAATGGDLGVLDGTFASLDPLWAWFLGYVEAGLPGVAVDARPSVWRRDWVAPPLGTVEALRMRVVGEEMDHYIRLVFARYSPPGEWVLFRTPERERYLDLSELVPGVMVGGVWTRALWGTASVKAHVEGSYLYSGEPDAMTRWLRQIGILPEGLVQERGASVLAPYLEVDLGPEPAESAVSPMWGWPELGPSPKRAPGPEPVDEGVTVWRGSWEALDELDQAGVLDAQRLAAVLAEVGGTVGGVPVTAQMLTGGPGESDVDVEIGEGLASVQVFLLDGTVRQVGAEPIEATKAQWRSLRAALRRYAKAEKGRLVADSAMQ